MPDLRANVRVISDDPERARPPADRVQEAAQRLTTLGFTVLRMGRFGVSVSAPEVAYERVLGCNPLRSDSASSVVSPADPQLRRLIDAVEVTPKPTLLA